MKNAIVLTMLVIFGFSLTNCKKSSDIAVSIKLINSQGQEINSFEYGDTTYAFSFLLYNNSSKSITYDYTNSFFNCLEFLKVFKKNVKGKYEYIGKPTANFSGPYGTRQLEANNIVSLSKITFKSYYQNWPILYKGSYYVGDTLTIDIDNERRNFYSRIYFSVN
jgi:hypothetical protein